MTVRSGLSAVAACQCGCGMSVRLRHQGRSKIRRQRRQVFVREECADFVTLGITFGRDRQFADLDLAFASFVRFLKILLLVE